MKKKVVILLFSILILVIIIGIMYWNNRVVSTINLDINPSIQIQLKKNNKVKKVTALNEDAKDVVGDYLNNKSLDDALSTIVSNLLKTDYLEDGHIKILLYSKGSIDNRYIETKIIDEFNKNNLPAVVHIIDKITKEDEELAKKYNISPSKAAYINEIVNENENVDIEYLVNKSIKDLDETKKTGNYCDEGYFLEGNRCYKEKERISALNGKVCPSQYYEYNGKCYAEAASIETDKFTCRDDYELDGKDCKHTDIYDARPECKNGDLYENEYCMEKKYIGDAYEFCRDPGRTLYEHKCLATKPTINGGCLGSDKLLNGKCVNTKNDYYAAEWKCANGEVKSNADGSLKDNDTKCYENIKTNSVVYTCEVGATLVGKKCQQTFIEPAERVSSCPSGYTKVDNGRCINTNKIINKTDGYYCKDDTARLSGDTCIIYDSVDAKHYK